MRKGSAGEALDLNRVLCRQSQTSLEIHEGVVLGFDADSSFDCDGDLRHRAGFLFFDMVLTICCHLLSSAS